jgi:hypothetical protein
MFGDLPKWQIIGDGMSDFSKVEDEGVYTHGCSLQIMLSLEGLLIFSICLWYSTAGYTCLFSLIFVSARFYIK